MQTAGVRYLLDSVYWTRKDAEAIVPLDPLGLDQMKEELADKLVPYLTGRTDSVEDAFWTLAFLRWSSSAATNDTAKIARFLEWERCLKLVWAHFKSTHANQSFPGVLRARSQSMEPEAPTKRFRPLLVNQRAQGMLGAYLRPLRKLRLVEENSLKLTERGVLWTNSLSTVPDLINGNWPNWKSTFEAIRRQGLRTFTLNFQKLLRDNMPELNTALHRAHWKSEPSWAQAAKWLGEKAPYARFADRFGRWAESVRETFDEIVFHGRRKTVLTPPFNGEIPQKLEGPRWDWMRAVLCKKPMSISTLTEWHRREYELRGKSPDQLWIVGRGNSFDIRRFNGSQSGTTRSDFRWSNAVSMMKPGVV